MNFLPKTRRFIFIFNLDNGHVRNRVVSSYQQRNLSSNFNFKKRSFSNLADETKSKNSKLKVVFFGTDLLSIQILSGLHSLLLKNVIGEIKVITSVSLLAKNQKNEDFDNLVGNQIIKYCETNNLNYNIWSEVKNSVAHNEILNNYDVGVVASFGHLLPSKLIERFPQ